MQNNTNWREAVIAHAKTNPQYSVNDLQRHFTTKEQCEDLAMFVRQNGHKRMREFLQTANDWQAFVPPALLSTVATYGLVDELPAGLVTNSGEDRESVTKRFVWKSEPIEDYSEGEAFRETFIEGAANTIRWRKPAAKITETREAALDLPLNVMQQNVQLTTNEFRAREWKHFSHNLHANTSNAFDTRAVLKNGEHFDVKWRDLFTNAYEAPSGEFCTFADIRNARAAMLRRERDSARPSVAVINASCEAYLLETFGSQFSAGAFLGVGQDLFANGTLPNVYGLTFVVVPDALHGYFTNDALRKNDTFRQSNDVFRIANNGPTIIRHTREALSTEQWQIFDGQKNALNLWERYEYSVFRHTNIMRIAKPEPEDEYGILLD